MFDKKILRETYKSVREENPSTEPLGPAFQYLYVRRLTELLCRGGLDVVTVTLIVGELARIYPHELLKEESVLFQETMKEKNG